MLSGYWVLVVVQLATAGAWPTYASNTGQLTVTHGATNTSTVGQLRIINSSGAFTFSAELLIMGTSKSLLSQLHRPAFTDLNFKEEKHS